MADHVDLPFAFGYLHRYLTKGGEGSRGGVPAMVLDHAVARIPIVNASNTQLVARLNTPASPERGRISETSFELRVVDGRLMRPTFRPGSFTPCPMDEFRAAAEGDVPWRDNPFDLTPSNGSRARAVKEVAKPVDAYPATAWARGSKAESARIDVMHKASQLVVIDGFVFRPTDEPRLEISRRNVEFQPCIQWSFHDFGQEDDPVSGEKSGYEFFTNNQWGLSYFRLDREADALRFYDAVKDKLVKFDLGPMVGLPKIVEHLDARLLKRREDIFETRKGLHRSFATDPGTPGYWAPILKAPLENITAYVQARDIVHGFGDGPVEESELREAFLYLDRALSCPEAASIDFGYLGMMMDRWRSCERNRVAASPDAPDEDDEFAVEQAFTP